MFRYMDTLRVHKVKQKISDEIICDENRGCYE